MPVPARTRLRIAGAYLILLIASHVVDSARPQAARSAEIRMASVHGATQIRAGVIRPEIIVPIMEEESTTALIEEASGNGQQLTIGTPIRIIREPYFGMLGTVTALPPELVPIPSGAEVRILEAHLENGRTVSVPRANIEIIEE